MSIDKLAKRILDNKGQPSLIKAREKLSKVELKEFKWDLEQYREEVLAAGKNETLLKMIDNAGLKKELTD